MSVTDSFQAVVIPASYDDDDADAALAGYFEALYPWFRITTLPDG
jgi:hypothetical protein